jgi:tetrahydromethanopterin S-methyltransferase subunit G
MDEIQKQLLELEEKIERAKAERGTRRGAPVYSK